MTRGPLHVAERDASVEGGSDERVAQTVRRDALVDPGSLHEPLDHAVGAVPVHPATFDAEEDRPDCAVTDIQMLTEAGQLQDERALMAPCQDQRLCAGAKDGGDDGVTARWRAS